MQLSVAIFDCIEVDTFEDYIRLSGIPTAITNNYIFTLYNRKRARKSIDSKIIFFNRL